MGVIVTIQAVVTVAVLTLVVTVEEEIKTI